MPTARALSRPLTIDLPPWIVLAVYFAAFLLLDWASSIRPLQNLNITLWNPQPALAVAPLLLWGRHLWWAVCLSLLACEGLLRGPQVSWFDAVAVAAGLTASYLAMAVVLSRTLHEARRLFGRRDVTWFAAVVAAGCAVNAMIYVGIYAIAGVLNELPLWQALARYWVGDAVGFAVTLPLLLALADAERRAALGQVLRRPQAWLIGGAICAALGLLFGVLDPQRGRVHAYLLPVLVVWAVARFGSAGGLLASALTQAGLIVAAELAHAEDLLVIEMQMRMLVIAMIGLILGIALDERARADAELRRSLHLVAAGQMSAALAHELNQPLTALTTYAQACEMLARPGPALDEARRRRQLVHVAARISADAIRAGDIVSRLRDFFRAGSTQLRPADIGRIARETMDTQSRRAQSAGIALELEWPVELPSAWVDAVQIAVVMRNLLANALDAMISGGKGGQVLVRGSRQEDALLIEVIDGGPGVSAAQAATLFEAHDSEKIGGMGVGLGICRAIVGAHGGRLWCETGPRGHFCFTLPLDVPASDTQDPPDEHHA